MDLSTILDGKLDKEFLVQLFQEQKEVYQHAIELAFDYKNPLAWKAIWILKHCTSKNDVRILPHVDAFVKILPHQKDGAQRETLNILAKIKLNDEQEGQLFDQCMSIWEQINKSPGVRYIAFKHIYNVCKKYPELNDELNFITQERYIESLSPGIQKGVNKLLINL